MALSNNTLPVILPERLVPFDVAAAFANPQTLTATGYVNAIQAQVDVGLGRFDGYWSLDVSNLKLSATDETYRFHLLGSNDASWTSGNIEVLASRDFAGLAANRSVPTICPASYAVPITGRNATKFVIPFTNLIGAYLFRYVQCYAIIGGTSPTVTLSSWVSPDLA